MELCPRHEDLLFTALELRGLLRPSLTADPDLTPLNTARQLIVDHATNFAGSGAIEMLEARVCPLCYVNQKNPARLNLDGWIENAAEEAAITARAATPLVIIH